jgi:hypothetical protein
MPDDESKPKPRPTSAFGTIGGPIMPVAEYNNLVRKVAELEAALKAKKGKAREDSSKGGKNKPPPQYEDLALSFVAMADPHRSDIQVGRDLRILWEKYNLVAWLKLLPDTDEGLRDGVKRIRERLAKLEREKSSGL